MCDNDALPEGAQSVGAFEEADPLARLYIWSLRRWLDGVGGQQAVWNHISARLGSRQGTAALSLLEAHLAAIAKHHRHSLCRHQAACSCIGRDERRLAAIVVNAANGDMNKAYAEAAPVVAPNGLFETVETATRLGRFLSRVGSEPPASSRQYEENAPLQAVRGIGGTLH